MTTSTTRTAPKSQSTQTSSTSSSMQSKTLQKPLSSQHPGQTQETTQESWHSPATAYARAQRTPASLQPADVAALQRTAGNRAVQRLLQRKTAPTSGSQLRVGPVNDRYEREADRIAAQVTGSSVGTFSAGKHGSAGHSVQRMGNAQGTPVRQELSQAIQSTRGGKPLDSDVRANMEQKFGTSFADVRIHANPHADQLNRALDARAFTKGRDIFFRQGEYQPGTAGGDRLLAHELTHVVQQSAGTIQRDVIQRVPTVTTNGGTWKANIYQTVDDGAEIQLDFEPNDTVNAKKIGLIQTSLKIEKGKNYDTLAHQQMAEGKFLMPAQKRKAQRSDGTRHIDRVIQKNNPIYGAENLQMGQSISATDKGKLNIGADAIKKGTFQNYQLGYRYKSLFGLKTNKRAAKLYDMPQLPGVTSALAKDPSQRSEMTFETAAVAIQGAQAGQYYGSVEWGWKLNDPDRGVELIDFKKKSDGNPSQEFQNTASNWNQGEFDEGFANPQIPLPPSDND